MGQELGGAGRGPGGRNLWLLYWQPWCSQEGERNTGWASKLLPLPASWFPLLSINSFMKSESVSHPVVSDSLWPRGLQPARLLCPWDSPGKNTGVGGHALLQGIFPTQRSNPGLLHCRQTLYRLSHREVPWWVIVVVLVTQLCLTLCDPMGCSPPGSSVHGILQARTLEWVLPFPSPGDLPDPEIEPGSPALKADSSPSEPLALPHPMDLEWYMIKIKGQ